MMGAGLQGLGLVRLALEALEKSLLGIPMGTELHTVVLKTVSELNRHLSKGSGDQADKTQALMSMAREQQQNPQAQALQRMQQGGGQPQPPMMPQ